MGLLNLMGSTDFNPRAELFANGEVGIVADIGDLTTLYQDSNGVTRATSVGDPVGLIIDRSKGGLDALGPELKGDGYIGLVGSATEATYDTATGVGEVTRVDIGNQSFVRFTVTTGKFYQIKIQNTGANNVLIRTGGAGGSVLYTSTPGTTVTVIVNNTSVDLFFTAVSGVASFVVSTIREIPGHSIYQATSGSRPAISRVPFGGRRNLLSSSEPMATQTRTVRAVEHTLSFQGTGTVTLSGTSTAGPLVGTGASDIVSLTFTPTAGSLTLTVSGTVTLAQLEEGAARSSYQRVAIAGTVVDCTESGVPDCWYLDTSSNKWMQTAAIDFTGTDEMTVIAGVRKLSDAAVGMVAELSVDANTNNGSFYLLAGPNTGTGPRWTFTPRGTATRATVSPASYTAPITNLLTGLVDISSDVSQLNIDGTLATEVLLDLGSGNFGNYALYIGSRAGSSLYLNGHIFQLIIRGKTTSGSKLTRAEKYIAKKTGLTI